jgi:hypothetical protein
MGVISGWTRFLFENKAPILQRSEAGGGGGGKSFTFASVDV